jgi:hypothetical protein
VLVPVRFGVPVRLGVPVRIGGRVPGPGGEHDGQVGLDRVGVRW